MIVYVENRDRNRHAPLIRSYFRLRKKVFHDQLRWEVRCDGDEERDELDDRQCTYVLSVDEAGEVNAGARLIPTTEKTLLQMAFPDLVPDPADFVSPTILESSRYCVRSDGLGERTRTGVKKQAVSLSCAALEYAETHGYSHIIAVVEERLFALTRTYTANADILGKKEINGETVLCAIWPVESELLGLVRRLRGLSDCG